MQAQKMEAVGRLAGGVAHDFNNLLTAVFCNIELVKEGVPKDDESYQLLDMAGEASKRAKHLTGQLLTFSKGGEPLKRVTPVGELVQDTSNFVLSGSNIKCSFDLAEDLLPVEPGFDMLRGPVAASGRCRAADLQRALRSPTMLVGHVEFERPV